MAGEYRIDGLAVPESLGLLHSLLEQVAADHPEVSADDLMLLETAVIEIAGNVVEHGRPPGEVEYTFELAVMADRLEALLTDTGEELTDPGGAAQMPGESEEAGRGLPLARAALDELSYVRDAEVNLWRMVRLCPERAVHERDGAGPAASAARPPVR